MRYIGGQRVVYVLRDGQPVAVNVPLGPPTRTTVPYWREISRQADLTTDPQANP